MKRPRFARRSLLFALKAAALVASLGWLGHELAKVDWSGVGARIHAIGPRAALVLLPFPIALALDTIAWRRLLRRLGVRIGVLHLFLVRVATEAVTNALPAGGLAAEALGPILIRDRAPVARSFASSATKRWLIIRAHGFYMAAAGILGFSALSQRSRSLVHSDALPWLVFGASLALFALSYGLERATTRFGLATRVFDALNSLSRSRVLGWLKLQPESRSAFAEADAHLHELGGAWHVLEGALLLGVWFLESAESFLILHLLGADVDFVTVLSFDAALSFVRTVAVFAPAGLGVQDVGYLAAFHAYGLPHAASIGPAFLVLKRTKELFFIAIGFVLLALFARRSSGHNARSPEAPSPSDSPPTTPHLDMEPLR